MKKTATIFLILGLAAVYLYLLAQRQITNVVQPPREEGAPFSFSIDEAPKDTLRGNIASLSGQVTWISRTATEEAVLSPDQMLQQGEDIATAGDGELTIVFPDAAKVILNPDTALGIIQTLPENLVFKLKAGRANFQSAGSAVSVTALHLLAIGNGDMDISLDAETGTVTIVAKQGTVHIGYNDLDYLSITADLKEGEVYLYDDITRTGIIDQI